MKIDSKAIKEAIKRSYKNKKKDEKVTILFSEKDGEIVFSGHPWAWNCFYTVSDLRRNNDFEIARSGDGEFCTLGAGVALTARELEKLADFE